jgi:GTPase SAR1 family protein
MKILLIQLSDIHFKEGENSVLKKEEKLFESIRNSTLEYDEIFLVVTGDTAFSGKEKEYEIGSNFLKGLKTKLEDYSKKNVQILTIAGNHDCDFDIDTKARQNQITIIQKLGDSAIDNSVINQCVEVQKNYFSFRDSIQETVKPAHDHPLLSVYPFDYGEKRIVFHCYNTAYMSEIHEQNGKMFYSTTLLPETVFNAKADLVISLFHHPFHWLNPTNRREFATHIHKTADFYLTGHEHTASKEMLDDLEENTVYHIEGSVLQDSGNIFESEFHLIGFDLATESFKIDTFFWNEDKYELSTKDSQWINYKRGKIKLKSKYNLTREFAEVLNDVGGKFRHPVKSDIKLGDIYVYPTLRYFNTKESSEDNISFLLENAESVIRNIKPNSKYLLFGGENIGKTSLLRTVFKTLYQKNYVPIIIDGKSIKNSGLDDFKKLVEKEFINQYGTDALEDFKQEDISNVFILIDDIDKNPLKNQKAKGRFIKSICNYYKNLFFIGNELVAIEEIIADEETPGDLFSEFHQYEILEFNHSMRAKLIQRWYTLGREEFVTDEETYKKIDIAMRSISIAMGQRIVPNYPIFLLILLQALESTNPHDLQVSSYGNYYQLLILKSLTDNIRDQSELNTYQSYCAELANFFFDKKTTIISRDEYDTFHKDISQFTKMDLPASMAADKTIYTLCKVGVLNYFGDNIEFKYQYTYYYFQAQFLAKNIAKEEIKEVITKLCQRLYRTEFANILMFLIHFSNDEFIITELIKNASDIFKELSPCKLENDISHLHELVSELPKLYLKSKTVEEVRNEENAKHDEVELQNTESEFKPTWDLDEDISEIDIVSKLNLSFKLIEIIGQILKNNPTGSMTGPVKFQLLKETYTLGLRTLNVFFSVLNDNTDFIINQLQEIISKIEEKRNENRKEGEKREVEKEKIEKISRQLLFSLCTQISYTFVKKISDSVGTSKLMDKYPMVQSEFDFASVRLINFLIKLDHVSGFPDRDMQTLKEYVEKHPMSYFLLKRMVINHLHRHPVDFKDRQRICAFLGIPIESQLRLEADRKKHDKK